MPELIAPDTRLHSAWLSAHTEWGPGFHEDGFGLGPGDDVDSPEGFAAWVARLSEGSCTHNWIVEDGQVHGGVALRCGDDDYIRQFGHIGYGIRPSSRRRGLATWALGETITAAREFGLERVLLVCAVDNAASVKTIERRGGVLEGVRETVYGPALRYWITT